MNPEDRQAKLRATPEFHALMDAMSAFFTGTPDPAKDGDGWLGHPSLAQEEDFLPLMRWVWRYSSLGDCCDRCQRICMPIQQSSDQSGRFGYRCPDCGIQWACSWGESMANSVPEGLM